MKSFAQLFEQISIRGDVLVIRQLNDTERELTIVPSARVKQIIRYYHVGPRNAN